MSQDLQVFAQMRFCPIVAKNLLSGLSSALRIGAEWDVAPPILDTNADFLGFKHCLGPFVHISKANVVLISGFSRWKGLGSQDRYKNASRKKLTRIVSKIEASDIVLCPDYQLIAPVDISDLFYELHSFESIVEKMSPFATFIFRRGKKVFLLMDDSLDCRNITGQP